MEQNSKVIRKNGPLPICEMYLIKVTGNRNGGQAEIVTTDLETSVINKIDCEAREKFEFVMPGEALKFLSKTEEVPLTISIDEKTLSIIVSTDSENAKYKGLAAEDYPLLPEVKITSEVDLSLIGQFMPFVGHDELRPIMTGVNLHNTGKGIRLVATNASMLKVSDVLGKGIKGIESIVIPPSACKLLKDFKAATVNYGVTVEGEKKQKYAVHAKFEVSEKLSIICRLIDGKYPNYENVIPTETLTQLKANVKEVISTVDKAALFANDTTKKICLWMNGTVEVSAEDPDKDKEFKATRAWKKTGNNLTIGFNSELLKSILKDLKSEDVTMEMQSSNRAMVIKENKTTWLLMPVML